MAKHSHRTGNQEALSKRSRIQNWLMQQQWKLTEAQDPNASWVVNAESGTGTHVTVIQPTGIPDQLLLQGAVNIDPEDESRLVAMEPSERTSLIWELRFGLLKLGVEFIGVQEPLRQVFVRKAIYSDALTKDAFLSRVGDVNNAVIFIIWTIQKARREPPQETSSELFH